MRKKLKTAGHWLFENGFPALFWSGLIVSLNLLLFEEYFQETSCDVQKSYMQDAAKMLFWAVFATRLAVIPIVSYGLRKKFNEHLPSQKATSRFEVEFNDGIETALFVFETLKSYSAPSWISYITVIPAIWPIFCSLYKIFHPEFSRGPKETYSTISSPVKRNLFIVAESLYNLLSLASAASFVATLLFNYTYSSMHSEDYQYQDQIVAALIIVSALVGAFSVVGKKSYNVMHYSEAASNTLYYSLNMEISSASCLAPSSFTVDGFKKNGWKYLLGFGAFSLVLSYFGGFHGTENAYEEEEEQESHAGNRMTMFPQLDEVLDADWPPITGLRKRNLPSYTPI